MTDDQGDDQLDTDQVFIDTQAFVREGLNWRSKSCARLKELVRSGHLQVLTTSVTRSEVRSKINDALKNARGAFQKHEVVLSQLDAHASRAALEDADAESKLQALFDEFLTEINAFEVALSKNVDTLFEDYFNERPPFSAKKKSEFPDAFVIASLRERAAAIRKRIYVVSGDSDMQACCAHVPELIVSEGLADIISKATVTRSVHDKLLSLLRSSSDLDARLTKSLKETRIRILGKSRADMQVDATGEVNSVDEVELHRLNVISQEGNTFVCDVECSAYLEVFLEVVVEGVRWEFDDYQEVSDEFSTLVMHPEYFIAELVVDFDAKHPDAITISEFSCNADVEIDISQIDELSRYKHRW